MRDEWPTTTAVVEYLMQPNLTQTLLPEAPRNEHEGIPANLIQQLDTCVEIPQQGVIRSLNVHVSGALLIWEYTRQQIIKENKER
ncbi:putative methyltransferase TARBP1 [Varanus komodoensis]|nr:putative methyltransferase TARBP1 [Varanus komodoensis]